MRQEGLLFLCVANSARSQIAEGIGRHFHGDRFRVQSAGTRPCFVHPLAVEVLAEWGIDATSQASKSVHDIDPSTVDVVITLCAQEACPAFLGQRERLHWPLSDPAGPGTPETLLDGFRQTRDEIRRRLDAWVAGRPGPGENAPGGSGR
ncbi:MAG: arsenate reductase ArsC [Acidobacteria bacterium]|nr:arsenate reductase ArsC [Acidobacteriota bacterium]